MARQYRRRILDACTSRFSAGGLSRQDHSDVPEFGSLPPTLLARPCSIGHVAISGADTGTIITAVRLQLALLEINTWLDSVSLGVCIVSELPEHALLT